MRVPTVSEQEAARQNGRRLLELLEGARRSLGFYPADHPLVVEGFKHLEFMLSDLFLASSEVNLAVIDGDFFLNEVPLKRESTGFAKLAQFLGARGASNITLLPEVSAEDLRRFVAGLVATEEGGAADGTQGILDGLGIRSILATTAVATISGSGGPAPAIPPELQARLDAARAGYTSAVGGMRDVFQAFASEGHIDYRTIRMTTEALLDSVVTNRNVWTHLLNVKHTDEYSFNHSVNVATLSLLLATRFGVSSGALSVLGEAALLHDLGKQRVPRDILQKEGALTDEEWTEMRSHPEKGAKILLGIREVTEATIMVAYEHHVRYDHKGYPRTRSKRSLHLFSHIVAVADIYDALTSDRGYRRALLPDMAMRIILTQSGTAFHPLVVKHFVNLVGIFPVGTFVRLKTQEIALVQHNQSRDLLRPAVLVIYDGEGRAIPPVIRDLAGEGAAEPPVLASVDPVAVGIDTTGLS